MRVHETFFPWRRHVTSYLVPTHPVGSDDSDRVTPGEPHDLDGDAPVQIPLPPLIPSAITPSEQELRTTYQRGWRDGYLAGYHAGLARAHKRQHHHGGRPVDDLAVTSEFDGGLHERSRYHP
jgi:hypothetical protein